MTILELQFNTSHPHPERKMGGFEEELEEPNLTPLRLSLFSERFSSVEMEGGGFTPPPHTGATIPFQWELTPGKPRSTGDPPPQTVRSLDLHPRMFSERLSSPEILEGGGFTSPPHTGATIPFQWELTPGKPRSTSHSPPQTIRSLDLPPRMFVNSAITTPTNNSKTKVETVWSPTSVLELEGPDFSMHSWSSSGKSKWKMMMTMPLRKMIMCKETPSPQFRSWSSVDISSRYGGETSPFWSFDDSSNSLDSKSKINKLSRRRSLIFFNKTTYSILESMNQSINQAVPWRR